MTELKPCATDAETLALVRASYGLLNLWIDAVSRLGGPPVPHDARQRVSAFISGAPVPPIAQRSTPAERHRRSWRRFLLTDVDDDDEA